MGKKEPGNLYEAVIALEGVKNDLRRLKAGETPPAAREIWTEADTEALKARLKPIIDDLTKGRRNA